MKSIFISSTRVDLIEHRAAVDSAIRRLEQRPINMDDFGSQPGGASGTSVREVDKGDIYIGILAHRYGYVPAGMDRSVTEQEYDRAVERNMPRLMYLVDPAYAWPDEFIEKDDPTAGYSAQDKLNQFKAKVGKAEVRSLFTTPDDLAEKVAIDLVKLLAEDRRQQRLFRVISAAVIVIVALVAAFISIPAVKDRVVEIAGIASPTLTHTPTPTLTFTPSPTSTPSPTPLPTATPLEGTPFAQGDVGVVFADFDVIDATAPHTERNIERALQNESVPFIHVHHTISERAEAQQIAQQYKATIVIWGEVALGGVSLSFEVNPPPASYIETTINGLEVSAGQLENFNAYIFEGMDILYIVDFIRGQVAYFSGDDDTALTHFNSAIEHIPAGREKDVHAEVLHFYRGVVYTHQQAYSRALDDYNQALQLAPQDVTIYQNRAVVYTAQQEYARALADYNHAIRLDPTDPVTYYNRANAYYDQQEYAHALDDYDQAIRLDPNYAQAYNNRGNIYFAQNDIASALSDYSQAIQLDPAYPDAYSNRGNVYSTQGDYPRALTDFNQAIQLDPAYTDAYYNRGRVYRTQGDDTRALADFNQVIQLNPNYADAYNARGNLYYDQQDFDHALADYTQAVQLDPTLLQAYNNRGLIYQAQSDLDQALADFNQAIRIDPNNPAPYFNRGAVYDDQQDFDHALADYTQAIQLDPSDSQSYFRRELDYLTLTFLETDQAKIPELARQAISDLRHAQSLGLTLSDNLESILTEIEAQFATESTPEATDSPGA